MAFMVCFAQKPSVIATLVKVSVKWLARPLTRQHQPPRPKTPIIIPTASPF